MAATYYSVETLVLNPRSKALEPTRSGMVGGQGSNGVLLQEQKVWILVQILFRAGTLCTN